jgi:hypothetical protein
VSNSFIMKEVGELFTTVRKKTKTLQENLWQERDRTFVILWLDIEGFCGNWGKGKSSEIHQPAQKGSSFCHTKLTHYITWQLEKYV